jgi:hypothetical protein
MLAGLDYRGVSYSLFQTFGEERRWTKCRNFGCVEKVGSDGFKRNGSGEGYLNGKNPPPKKRVRAFGY